MVAIIQMAAEKGESWEDSHDDIANSNEVLQVGETWQADRKGSLTIR